MMKKHILVYALFALLAVALALPLFLLPASAECTVHTYHGVEMPLDKVYTPAEVQTMFGNGPTNCLERGSGSFTCDACGTAFLVTVKGACDFERTPATVTLPSPETEGKLVLSFDCSLCEDTYTVATDSFLKNDSQAASCQQSGVITYAYSNVPHPDGTPVSGTYNEYSEQLGHYYDNGNKIEIDEGRPYMLSELNRIFGDSSALTLFGDLPTDCSEEIDASYVCSGCHQSFLFTAVGDHDYSFDADASRIEEGSFAYVCSKDASHTLTVQADAYEVIVNPATCLSGGSKFVLCTYTDPWGVLHTDAEFLLETYERLPYHTYGGKEIDLAKTYTLTELKTLFGEELDGLTVYDNMRPTCSKSAPASFRCDGCELPYLIQHIADHAYSDFTEHEPTCTTPGYRERTCTVCGDIDREDTGLPALPHTYGEWEKYDAEQHVRACACGKKEYAPHAWDAGVETTPPTVAATGVMTYTCTDCRDTRTEEIPKLMYTKPTATASLVLGDRFTVHAKVLLPVSVTVTGEVGMLVNGEAVALEGADGVFTLNALLTVAVKDADTAVSVTPYYDTPEGDRIMGEESRISVVTLLRAYLESESEQTRRLATATLHYIAAAQDYFACDVLIPVNDGLAPLPSTGSYTDRYMISTAPDGATVRPLYFSLILGDTVSIKAVFSCEGETDGYRLAISRDIGMADATTVALTGNCAIVDDILPRDFDTTYFFCVLDADGNAVSATFTYGVSTYFARMQGSEDAKLTALLDSMLALYETVSTLA